MRDSGEEAVATTGLVLDRLVEVLGSLRTAGIDYCYWRGNRRLEATLSGLSDLDLLVGKARTAARAVRSGVPSGAGITHGAHQVG
jgi:hypothetical protein